MWRSRWFWRLFVAQALLLLAALGLLGVVLANRVEQRTLAEIEGNLRTRALLVREAVRDQPTIPPDVWQQRLTSLGKEIGCRITLLAADGRVLADSDEDPSRMDNRAQRPEVLAAAQQGFGSATRYSDTLHQRIMSVALRTDDSGAVAWVQVAVPLDRLQEHRAALSWLIVSTALGTGLVALVLAFWQARQISQPIRELTAGAEQIAAGNPGHKVYVPGHDEVAHLARAFNHMSEQLADQFAQLESEGEQLRAILSGMIEGVVALDAEQRILFANERAAQFLEFSAKAAVGRKLWEVVRRRALQEVVDRALAGPSLCRQEMTWNGVGGRSLTVHAAPLLGPGAGREARGAVLVVHDTSDLRRLERHRQEFVANVSHELKTPLSVIAACVETLQNGALEDVDNRGVFVDRIARQAERLHALILDLLSLARIEAGEAALDFQDVSLATVVGNCLDHHRARAEARNQILEGVPPADDNLTAHADEEAIGQILDNLIDNALKYTPEGGHIWVRWRADGAQVCLEVEDTGVGIPEQDLSRIFERFYRVDKARSRELGGTGLGLAIVKHLAQALHGSVQANSRLGQGTVFTVRLPRAPVA